MMKNHLLSLALLFGTIQCAFAQPGLSPMLDHRGYIDVFALRKAVSGLETLFPASDPESCETKTCTIGALLEAKAFEHARSTFTREWGPALMSAIKKGDEVAEVIWRQCSTTSVIERDALASTCDPDPTRRKEAARRLRQIGFEAALDSEAEGNPPASEPDQGKRLTLNQGRTIGQMKAGVYGGLSIDDHHGGNAPGSPAELADIRRAAVIYAASTLVRRSFTYIRSQGNYRDESHAQLRLKRNPVGTSTLAWSANVFNSGHPYTGPYDPAWDGFDVYLDYEPRRQIKVGGKRDAQYRRMLSDTLTRSEERIDHWLKRDPRWSVFLLHRRGHHEWIPEGAASPFGRLSPEWNGAWVLDNLFVNFKPLASLPKMQLSIRTGEAQSIAQFEEAGVSSACELRYSGGSSYRPEDDRHAKTATSTALGYLPDLAPVSPHDAGPVAPFAPLNPRKSYRQVLVQCPQGEWPDNRNKRFLFLANDTLIEIRKMEGSRDLAIYHWRRQPTLAFDVQFVPLARPFDLTPTLVRLAQEATLAEKGEAQLERIREQVSLLNADELIASLMQLRLEKAYYSPESDFPVNLKRLIATPDIAIKICLAYRANPPDSLQRFNFMVVLNKRSKNEVLTAEELAIVPDCLRHALNDTNAWVRLEAMDAFGRFAQERDRAKIIEMLNDPSEDVRGPSRNALLRLKSTAAAN